MDNVEQFYELIAGLKTYKRRLVSNLYMSVQEIASLIEDGKIFYYYMPGKYINFWIPEWDFVRLYYYIADVDSYDVPIIFGKVVCDIFLQKKAESSVAIKRMLEKAAFHEYAFFRKYIQKANMERPAVLSEEIITGTAPGFYELLRECFDVYTDLIPEPDRAEKYLDQEICYSTIDDEGEITGGVVISKRGSIETEEFIFVKPGARGRGIARKLREYYYANADADVTKFVSWVKDDNEFSWRQLLHLGYQEGNTYKITMMKG